MAILTTLDSRKAMRGLALLIGALLLAFAGQSQFAHGGLVRDALILWVAGVALFVLAAPTAKPEPVEPAQERRMGLLGWGLAGAGVALTLVAMFLLYRRGASDVALWLWIAGIALFLAAFLRTFHWSRMRIERRELLILLAILALALFMRAWRLDSVPAGAYLDEADNALWALRFPQSEYTPFTEHRDSNATFYFYYLYLFLKAFGATVLAMRWAAVILGLGLVLTFYFLARRLFGILPAQLATGMLAVNHWHINFSRMGFEALMVPLFQALTMLFLFRGLETRRKADFAFAGLAFGLGFHTYIGYRIFPITLLILLVYVLATQRGWLRQNVGSLLIFTLATLVTLGPLGVFVAQRPETFLRRTQAASVQQDIESAGSYRPVWDNLKKNLLMFNYQGDPRARHNLPREPQLDFWTAIAFGLGGGYSLWNWRKRRHFAPLLWLFVGLAPSVLSLSDSNPHSLRSIGNVPAVFCLVAAFWDAAAGVVKKLRWPAVERVALGATALVLCAAVVLNYQVYFVKQAANQSAYYDFDPVYNAAGQYIKDHADEDLLLVSFALTNHSAVKFIPYGKQYASLDPNRHIPLREDVDRDVIYVLEPTHAYFLPTLQTLYPAGELQAHKDRYGATAFYTFKVTRDQVTQSQGVSARFFAGDEARGEPAVERHYPRLDLAFAGGDPLPAPFTAVWEGSLYVPGYGPYALILDASGTAEVMLGQETILKAEGGIASVQRVLSGGFQPLRVTYRQTETEGRMALRWITPAGNEAAIPQNAFYTGDMARFGLLGRYYRGAENWSGQPALMQIDPFVAANDVILAPFSIEWQGMIYIPADGQYLFATISDDGSLFYIDNQLVVDNGGHHGDQEREGRIQLTKGYHPIGVRYFQVDGGRKLELWWTPPGRAREQIPATYLLPPGASQDTEPLPPPPVGEQPAQPTQPTAPAQAGQAPAGAQLAPLADITLTATWGGEGDEPGKLRSPRGVAIGPQGLVYVADSGNKRVQVFRADGTFVRAWNQAGESMVDPFDIVVDGAGRVFVLDAGRQTIARFSAEGQFQIEFGADVGMYGPRGLGIDAEGNLYATDTGNSRIFKFSSDGQMLNVWGETGSGRGQLQQPTDVAVDGQGRLYIADLLNARVQVWDAGGTYQGDWPLNGANSTDSPHLIVTPAGRVVLSDPEAHKVLVFDGRGTRINEIGGEGAEPGQFRKTFGVALGQNGVLAISDVYNSRIQIYSVGEGG